tara:strand:- start:39 stop:512 length:474 start_codon:yes stop_codon:yes gene_type:complete
MNIQKIIFLFLILPLLVFSCGYKKINETNEKYFHIQKIEILGDKKIGYLLKNEILLISSNSGKNKINIQLDINKSKEIKTKDASGKVTKYKIILNTNMKIRHMNNTKIIDKNFIKSINFDVAKNHSDTINKEKISTKNLGNQMAEDIINFLNIYYKG